MLPAGPDGTCRARRGYGEPVDLDPEGLPDPEEGPEQADEESGSDDLGEVRPLLPHEREDVLAELEDLATYRALLEHRGIRGIAVDCADCGEMHYLGWDLLDGNLRQLLDEGHMHVHEPAYDPDPADYVSWDYARGFADGVLTADED